MRMGMRTMTKIRTKVRDFCSTSKWFCFISVSIRYLINVNICQPTTDYIGELLLKHTWRPRRYHYYHWELFASSEGVQGCSWHDRVVWTPSSFASKWVSQFYSLKPKLSSGEKSRQKFVETKKYFFYKILIDTYLRRQRLNSLFLWWILYFYGEAGHLIQIIPQIFRKRRDLQ